MPLSKEQLSQHNTVYFRQRPFWTDCLNLKEPLSGGFGGASETLAFYLNRYAKEDRGEWAERLKRLAQINFLDQVVDQYCAYLFSTSIVFKAEAYEAEVDAFVQSCNLEGDSLQDYAREVIFPTALTYGVCDVFCDLPTLANDVVSLADQQASGIAPYCYVVPPLNRTAWKLDDARQYVEYRSSDIIDTQIQASAQIKDKTQYSHWTQQTVEVYDEDGKVLSSRPNPFGFIPATSIIPWPSMRFYRDRIGLSLVKDVVPLQKMVLNLISLIFDFHESVNFAHRVWVQDTENGEDVPPEGEMAELGNHRMFAMRGGKSRFEVVTPDAGGVESMCGFLDQVIHMIYQSVNLPSDSNFNKTHQTQGTIRSNHAQLFNRLTRIAKYGEKALKQVVDMALKVQGLDPKKAQVKVSWNTNFSFDAFITSIEQLMQLRKALSGNMSPTAEAEYAKKIIEPQLYNTGSLDAIYKEMESYVKVAKEQATLAQQQMELGVQQQQDAAQAPSLQQENTQASAASKVSESES